MSYRRHACACSMCYYTVRFRVRPDVARGGTAGEAGSGAVAGQCTVRVSPSIPARFGLRSWRNYTMRVTTRATTLWLPVDGCSLMGELVPQQAGRSSRCSNRHQKRAYNTRYYTCSAREPTTSNPTTRAALKLRPPVLPAQSFPYIPPLKRGYYTAPLFQRLCGHAMPAHSPSTR